MMYIHTEKMSNGRDERQLPSRQTSFGALSAENIPLGMELPALSLSFALVPASFKIRD